MIMSMKINVNSKTVKNNKQGKYKERKGKMISDKLFGDKLFGAISYSVLLGFDGSN